MLWKRIAQMAILLVTIGLTACHVVDESESQITLAKPAGQFVAQVAGKVQEISPSIALPHSVLAQQFTPIQTYILQPNNPAYVANFAHQDTGCKWIGVAGQVFDMQRNPVPNVVVQLKGTMNGTPITELGMTGAAPIYGPAGYEILLGGQPFDSQASFTIQLLDTKGKPLSSETPFNTYKDCQKNLILLNFIEVIIRQKIWMPIVSQGGQP